MNEENAYQEAINFARSHYENFPVVSFLVPAKLRKHIAVIYWFARTADDFADEENLSKKERAEKLDELENRLTELLNGNYSNHFELALFSTINEKDLSHEHFYNLLKAFRQDVTKNRYENFDELLFYCTNSANPVGRLILELYGIRNEEAMIYSDTICTALQLTNFWQDTMTDYQKGRIYYTTEEMAKFSVTENMFELKENNFNLRELVKYNVDRTEELFTEGRKLLSFLKGRLKYEIMWTILGGEKILDKIRRNNYNVNEYRPVITKKDFLFLLIRSILFK